MLVVLLLKRVSLLIIILEGTATHVWDYIVWGLAIRAHDLIVSCSHIQTGQVCFMDFRQPRRIFQTYSGISTVIRVN
jgi:hypothetical protein